jgi:NADPH:quinone reductase-like Zn-dependent oxidoreductase
MRAIIIKQFGGLDGLVIEKLPDAVPKPGSVLIEVKAFGINHAETHMRKGEWAARQQRLVVSSVLGL